MTAREVRCVAPGCATLNRVPLYQVRLLPKCGRCGTPLPEFAGTKALRWLVRYRVLAWIAPIVVVGFVLASLPPAPVVANLPPVPSVVDECKDHAQPRPGVYKWYGPQWGRDTAPLTIETSEGANYFVKLEDELGRPVRAYFIKGGSTFSWHAPPGIYTLKYATGRSWCDEQAYFGSSTLFSQADDTFSFDEHSGWTITLIQRKGGNLRTHQITRDKF